VGKETPVHFNGFSPIYQMRHLPPTSLQALESARDIAMSEGLEYVYIGNRQSEKGENTYCPECRNLLIQRVGYTVLQNRLKDGCCPDCGRRIHGVWK
jgi:pyruvate formate lyase activating enzyme